MPDRQHHVVERVDPARLATLEHRTAQDIVATAAHELNGPLTVLIGLVDLLERDSDLTPADRLEMVEAMGRQARYLAAVVADVLQVTNGNGSPAPTLEPVSLVEVVPEALDATPLRDDASVQVCVEGEATADRVGLTRVLTNLLTNAHRYGGPRISVTSRADGQWTDVTVADDGPGVPADLRGSLFDRYTRGGSSDDHHGLGIGLRVSRDLVESFGGTLTFEPELPTGSRFTIHLRTAPPESGG